MCQSWTRLMARGGGVGHGIPAEATASSKALRLALPSGFEEQQTDQGSCSEVNEHESDRRRS